jgi:Protein of unknown function (DUF1194)
MSKKKLLSIGTYAVLLAFVAAALMLPRGLGIDTTLAVPASTEAVQLELVLLIDTSGSVDASEYELQKAGYEAAFRAPELIHEVESRGGIAVLYVEWSDTTHQDVRIGWTRLDDEADCLAYADQVQAITRSASGETSMAPAIQFACDQIQSNSYRALRRIIDISGDGRCKNYDYYKSNSTYSSKWGTPWNDIISSNAGRYDEINGICITTDSSVIDFYQNVLPHGGGAFAMQVSSFSAFADVILQKLIREVRTVPPVYD